MIARPAPRRRRYAETIAGLGRWSSPPAQPTCGPTRPPALAPLRFPYELRLSPEHFGLLCAENRDVVMGLAADGHVIAMSPNGGETGARNARLEMRLLLCADQQDGWKLCGCSSGFRLLDGSDLSPDAWVIHLSRWHTLSLDECRGFAPLRPGLVVDLSSSSEEGLRDLSALRSHHSGFQMLLHPDN